MQSGGNQARTNPGEETRRILKGVEGRERQSGARYHRPTEVDDQLLSVKLTQREQGPAICSKVNGKETRWGGDTAQSGRQRGRERSSVVEAETKDGADRCETRADDGLQERKCQ